MTPLSPQAQAVWSRFCGIVESHGPARMGLAAALRAAADQVVPEGGVFLSSASAARTRRELLAIADELDQP